MKSLALPRLILWILAYTSVHGHQQCSWNLQIINTEGLVPTDAVLRIKDTGSKFDVQSLVPKIVVAEGNTHVKENYYAYPQSLKIDVQCSGDPAELSMIRSLALSGGCPHVQICDSPTTNEYLVGICHSFQATLMDKAAYFGGVPDCDEKYICNPTWVVPLPTSGAAYILHGSISLPKTGFLIDSKRFTIRISGFDALTTISPTLSEPSQQTLNFIPAETPTLILKAASNSYILSDDEFTNFHVSNILNADITNYGSAQCGCLGHLSDVFSVGALTDRLIFLTKSGVIELLGDYNNPQVADDGDSSLTPRLSLASCVQRMSLPVHPSSSERCVLVSMACSADNKVYAAKLQPRNGSLLSWAAVVDNNEKGVCSMLEDTTQCEILSLASEDSEDGLYYFLLDATFVNGSSHYVLTRFTGEITKGSWQLLFSTEKLIPSISALTSPLMLSLDNTPTDALTLTGLSLAPWVSKHVYLWGSHILHSSDGGTNFFLLPWQISGQINLWTSNLDGMVAFYTSNYELWATTVGHENAYKLYPSSAWGVAHQMRGTAPPVLDDDVISMFFDVHRELQIILWDAGSTTVVKHQVRADDILAEMGKAEQWLAEAPDIKQSTEDAATSLFHVEDACPFFEAQVEVPKTQKYARQQELHYDTPLLTGNSYSYSNISFYAYHAVSQNLFYHFSNYDNTYADNFADHPTRWRKAVDSLQPYSQYLFENNQMQDVVFIDLEEYYRVNISGSFSSEKLPDVIYLDKGDTFTFKITVTARENVDVLPDMDSLGLNIAVSNPKNIAVSVEKDIISIKHSVNFKVTLEEIGGFGLEGDAGSNLTPVSVEIRISNSPMTCFKTGEGEKLSQGLYHTTVMLGCPPTQRLLFDWQTSFAYMDTLAIFEHPWDCLYPDPVRPCFYYSNSFYPYFLTFDDTTGVSKNYTGNYVLKVIGGSHISAEAIQRFSQSDVEQYNNILLEGASPSLIWGPGGDEGDTFEGYPVYYSSNNTVSWFCQIGSPCTNTMPIPPSTPEYYFLVEFTNKKLVKRNTYCDFTVEFVMHVHGLPIDPLRMSLLLVCVSILSIIGYIIIYVACNVKRRKGRNWIAGHLNTVFQAIISHCHLSGADDEESQHNITNRKKQLGGGDQLRRGPPRRKVHEMAIMEEDEEEDDEDGNSDTNGNNSNNSLDRKVFENNTERGDIDLDQGKDNLKREEPIKSGPDKGPTKASSKQPSGVKHREPMADSTRQVPKDTKPSPMIEKAPTHGHAIGMIMSPNAKDNVIAKGMVADKFIKQSLATKPSPTRTQEDIPKRQAQTLNHPKPAAPGPTNTPKQTQTPINTTTQLSGPSNTSKQAQTPINTITQLSGPTNNPKPAQTPINTTTQLSGPSNTSKQAQTPINTITQLSGPSNTSKQAQTPINTTTQLSGPSNTSKQAQTPLTQAQTKMNEADKLSTSEDAPKKSEQITSSPGSIDKNPNPKQNVKVMRENSSSKPGSTQNPSAPSQETVASTSVKQSVTQKPPIMSAGIKSTPKNKSDELTSEHAGHSPEIKVDRNTLTKLGEKTGISKLSPSIPQTPIPPKVLTAPTNPQKVTTLTKVISPLTSPLSPLKVMTQSGGIGAGGNNTSTAAPLKHGIAVSPPLKVTVPSPQISSQKDAVLVSIPISKSGSNVPQSPGAQKVVAPNTIPKMKVLQASAATAVSNTPNALPTSTRPVVPPILPQPNAPNKPADTTKLASPVLAEAKSGTSSLHHQSAKHADTRTPSPVTSGVPSAIAKPTTRQTISQHKAQPGNHTSTSQDPSNKPFAGKQQVKSSTLGASEDQHVSKTTSPSTPTAIAPKPQQAVHHISNEQSTPVASNAVLSIRQSSPGQSKQPIIDSPKTD